MDGSVFYEVLGCLGNGERSDKAVTDCRMVITYQKVVLFGTDSYDSQSNTFQFALYMNTGIIRLLVWTTQKLPLGYPGFILGISGGYSYLKSRETELVGSSLFMKSGGYAHVTISSSNMNGKAISPFAEDFTVETYYKIFL